MKKTAIFGALALAAATLSGCMERPEITALVEGQNVVAVEVEYERNLDPTSITADAYQVNGQAVEFAKAIEEDKVILILGDNCGKMHAEKCADCKDACEQNCTGKCADCKCEGECTADCPCGCGGECKGQCGDCKGECADCKGDCKADCDSVKCETAPCKAEMQADAANAPAPAKSGISANRVRQVAPISDINGKAIKAWSRELKPSEAKPFLGMKHRRGM